MVPHGCSYSSTKWYCKNPPCHADQMRSLYGTTSVLACTITAYGCFGTPRVYFCRSAASKSSLLQFAETKNELQFICAAPPALELLDLASHALLQLGLARPRPFTHARVALAISICSPMPLPPVLRAPLVSMFLRARFFCCRALLASALPAAIRLPRLAASRERCGTSTAAPRLLWLCGQRLLKLHCAVHGDRGQLRGGPHTTRRGDGMTVATKH